MGQRNDDIGGADLASLSRSSRSSVDVAPDLNEGMKTYPNPRLVQMTSLPT